MSIDITDQQVFGALRLFLQAILPTGTEIVQAQDNRVSMPLGSFVTMNDVGQTRLSTNVATYAVGTSNPGTKSVLTPIKYAMQLDFYGPLAAAWATMAQAMFRDEFACNLMPSNIQPMYADDPMQIPLIDGESQYEQRWKLTAMLQYNPLITVPQDFAAQLASTVINVKAAYP